MFKIKEKYKTGKIFTVYAVERLASSAEFLIYDNHFQWVHSSYYEPVYDTTICLDVTTSNESLFDAAKKAMLDHKCKSGGI